MTATAPENTRSARWRILALLFACRASVGLQFQTLGSIADPLVTQFGFDHVQIGSLIGLFMLPGLLLSLPAGWAARHASDRKLVTAGLLLLAVGGGISALAHGFGLLALGRLVAGAGFVLSTLYFTKMVVDWFSGFELATALGILVMSWPFGIAAGQVGHAWLAVALDWRAPFVLASVCCAAAAAAVGLTYRAPPGMAGAPGVARMGLPRDELLLTLLAAVVWGLFNAGYIVYLSFAPQVLVAGGYGVRQAASVISIASWVMISSLRHGRVLELLLHRRDCHSAAGRLAVRSNRKPVHGDRVRSGAFRRDWVGVHGIPAIEAIARASCTAREGAAFTLTRFSGGSWVANVQGQ